MEYYWKAIIGIYSAGIIFILAPPLALIIGFISINPNDDLSALTSNLKDSTLLIIAHYCCIVSIFPIAIDSIMDFFEQNATISDVVHLKERSVIFLSFALDSIVYISFRHFSIIPFLYVSMTYTKTIIIIAAIFNAVYAEYRKHLVLSSDPWLIRLLTVTAATWTTAFVLNSYTLYSNSQAIVITSYILNIGALIFGLSCFFRWSFLVTGNYCICAYRVKISQLSMPEFSSLVYITSTIVYFVSIQVWNTCLQDFRWQTRRESTLVYYAIAALFFNFALLVVPGRIIRMLAVMNMKQLSLKQTFVRHVSHEIRSPLNVVRVGLDILRTELTRPNSTTKIDPATLELLEDIISSSETSIDILNELLDYEHMDAGNFRLETKWHPLPNLLEGKLSWVRMLAEKKKVKLSMIDSTVATEFGLLKKVAKAASRDDDAVMDVLDLESNDSLNPRLHDTFNGSTSTDSPGLESIMEAEKEEERGFLANDSARQAQETLYMNIDTHKIEQVIRNLITNAFKFTPADGTVVIKMGCELFGESSSRKVASRVGAGAVGIFRVDVTDTGAGIAVEDQKKLFGEFTQFNKNELQAGGGSGLGLWISKRIVRMHEGYMGFYSEGVGHGATFFFELPVFSAPPAGSEPMAAQSSPKGKPPLHLSSNSLTCAESGSIDALSSPVSPSSKLNRTKNRPDIRTSINSLSDITYIEEGRLSKVYCDASVQEEMLFIRRDFSDEMELNSERNRPPEGCIPLLLRQDQRSPLRFLVVDDSSMNRRMIKLLIESETDGILSDAIVLLADDGVSAVECLRSEIAEGRLIDFVLMDFVMLKMNGPEAASVMRKELHYTGHIIGVTGNALPEDITKFQDGGANRVLTKPLTKAKLIDTLREYACK